MRTSSRADRNAQATSLAVITEVATIGALRGLPEMTWRVGLTGACGTPTALTTAEQIEELAAWAAALGRTPRVTAHGARTVVDVRHGVFLAVDHPASIYTHQAEHRGISAASRPAAAADEGIVAAATPRAV